MRKDILLYLKAIAAGWTLGFIIKFSIIEFIFGRYINFIDTLWAVILSLIVIKQVYNEVSKEENSRNNH